ncbi:unnamed protein product [Spodoptera exigua]|nr:unnamed protein product [Spodoptera exigua]
MLEGKLLITSQLSHIRTCIPTPTTNRNFRNIIICHYDSAFIVIIIIQNLYHFG